jgi:hypothetical protein
MKNIVLAKIIFIALVTLINVPQFIFGQKLIKEFSSLVHSKKDAVYNGEISISGADTSVGNNCREWKCSVKVSYRSESSSSFSIFSPGVKITFNRNICLATKEEDISTNSVLSMQTSIGMLTYTGKDNPIPVYSNQADISGIIKCRIEYEKQIFEINAIDGEPLVFIVRNKGMEYISGKGTVITPKGKKYTYK